MAYTSGAKKYAGAAKPNTAHAPAGGKQTPGPKKNLPSHDIVLVDGEGQIVKDDEGKSVRLGAIWTNEKGGMFIKFGETGVEPGSVAKAFAVTPKE